MMIVNHQRAKYSTIGASRGRKPHALVKELWAIRGNANKDSVRRIADISGLPVKWLNKLPGANGDSGLEKLQCERDVLLLRNRKSSFIDQFQHPLGRCAKFYKLTTYNNCNYWCEYCYLYLTFRRLPISTHFVNYEQMFTEIETFDKRSVPASLRVLNLGELGDPLAVDDLTEFSRTVVPFMPEQASRTKLLFLTKSDCVDNLLDLNHGGQTIISFSINTEAVHEHLEHRTPSSDLRLSAARKVQEAGYEVRLRIDPVFHYSTWEKDYLSLVDQILGTVKPSRITIGEYRPATGLGNHIKNRFPESPLLKVNGSLIREEGKLRYPKKRRVQMFRTIVSQIRRRDKSVDVALCKESPDVWKAVGLPGNGLCCNCLA